ncbi:MAG: TetR/AcrR family transcriptional regulator [Chitinophagaceae bacterium]|nr:MAG: TetR/AcrR family transcriptional regulator [Chitinophagaceae bacterium]
MSSTIQIRLSHRSYLRDPEETELGRKIVTESIRLIERIGIEQFTFKKLAVKIESTEASVYRYFENKHKLLVYLMSWYWAWLDYQINYQTKNIADPTEKLHIVLRILAELHLDDPSSPHIDESLLHRIVIAEAPKAYLTKDVDELNQEGLFMEYKAVCRKVADIVLQIKPSYPYPHALVSTLIEAAHQQAYFGQHLPSLTESKIKEQKSEGVTEFLGHLAFSALKGCGQ